MPICARQQWQGRRSSFSSLAIAKDENIIINESNNFILFIFVLNSLYENIGINETYPELLKCKGDCLLHGIIINNIYEEKYNLEECVTVTTSYLKEETSNEVGEFIDGAKEWVAKKYNYFNFVKFQGIFWAF